MYRVKWFLVFVFVKTELVSLPVTSKVYRLTSSFDFCTYIFISVHIVHFILHIMQILFCLCYSLLLVPAFVLAPTLQDGTPILPYYCTDVLKVKQKVIRI